MSAEAAERPPWAMRTALRRAAFAEHSFPDAYVFAVLGVVVVAACAIGFRAAPRDVCCGCSA